ncbi:MAG: hypothetical protein JWQ03_79 [Variovorax sp.]|nr:hypothetical protein [Variovorax sp.]
MAKTEQSKAELLEHLRDSLGFLEASSASFDAGFFGEAKRLATTIRVLVHDTDKSKSLLGLLKMKVAMGYLNTSHAYEPKNLVSYHGLVGIRLEDENTRYWAPLGERAPARSGKYVFFPDWWSQVVIVDSLKAKFTRRELVLALANKDGGAHVDSHLDESYAELTRKNSVGWMISDGTNQKPMLDVELHSVRQVAFELHKSIRRHLEKTGAAV